MACSRCNKKNLGKQSSRMPLKRNNVKQNALREKQRYVRKTNAIKRGIEIPENMTPDERRVTMHKVANAPKLEKQRQSREEHQQKIRQALIELAEKNKRKKK